MFWEEGFQVEIRVFDNTFQIECLCDLTCEMLQAGWLTWLRQSQSWLTNTNTRVFDWLEKTIAFQKDEALGMKADVQIPRVRRGKCTPGSGTWPPTFAQTLSIPAPPGPSVPTGDPSTEHHQILKGAAAHIWNLTDCQSWSSSSQFLWDRSKNTRKPVVFAMSEVSVKVMRMASGRGSQWLVEARCCCRSQSRSTVCWSALTWEQGAGRKVWSRSSACQLPVP